MGYKLKPVDNPFIDEKPSQKPNPIGEIVDRLRHEGQTGYENLPRNLGYLGRSLLEGATLGGYDEAKSAIQSQITGEPYSDIHKREMEKSEAVPTKFRVLGNLLGSLPSAYLAPAKILKPLMRSKSVAKKYSAVAGVGTAEGTIAGALYAKPGERERGAKIGAKWGLGIGATVPVIAKAGQLGWSMFSEKLARLPVPEQWGGDAARSAQSVRDWAIRKIVRSLERDGFTPQQAMAELEKLGPAATLADAGKNIKMTAAVIAGKPGRGASIIEETLESRDIGQMPRIVSMLDEALETPGKTIVPVIERSPAYKRALSKHVPLTATLRRILERPSSIRAWKDGQEIAREKHNIDMPDIEDVLQDANIKGISTQYLHWMKMAMDDAIEIHRKQQTGLIQATRGKSIVQAMDDTRRNFRKEIKFLNRDYGKLLDVDHFNFSLRDAHQKGYEFARLKNRRLVEEQIASLRTPQERRAYQRGVYDAIVDTNIPRSEVGYDVTSYVIRLSDKLEAVFGKNKAEKLINALKQERKLRRNTQTILGGSPTQPRQAAAADWAGDELPDIATDAAMKNPRLLASLPQKVYRWFTTPGEAVSDEAAKILMTLSPAQRASLAREFNRAMGGGTPGSSLSLSGGPVIATPPLLDNVTEESLPDR
jgi:hypothetical protein